MRACAPQAAERPSECPPPHPPCLQANIAVAKAKRVLKELQAQVGIADSLLYLQTHWFSLLLCAVGCCSAGLFRWDHELQCGITDVCL